MDTGVDRFSPEWDQISIDTPELVSIDLPVAGLGSRFVALIIDYLIWLFAFIALSILSSLLMPGLLRYAPESAKYATAIFILVPFVLLWGYFSLFEAFWNGRTPGKRVARIRVIKKSGRGISLFEALTRNLLRVVDQLPGIYVVGVICIFCTRQSQRLGDMAAGTLVVHEREQLIETGSSSSARMLTAGLFDSPPPPRQMAPAGFEVASAGVQRLNGSDLELLEGFFARRLDFTMETRAALGVRIAEGIVAKTGLAIPEGVSPETFLEEVARQLRDLVRMR